MDVISKRINLTAWGRLYGFNKATTSRLACTMLASCLLSFSSSNCPMDATMW